MNRHNSEVLKQLKERHLARWGIAYIAAAWVTLQAAELLAGIFDWSTVWLRVLTILLVFGFFVAITLAWFHGEKGQQRFSGFEAALIVLIAIAATVTTYSMDLKGVDAPPPNLIDGKASKRATANTYFEGDPSWSPGSGSLVFVSERSGNTDLWLLQRSGGETQLTDDPAEDTQPAWSPNGHTILFVSSRAYGEKLDRSVFFGYAFGGDIWSVPAFGGQQRKLIDNGYNPTWSPNGETFAFDSSRDGSRRIWTASADGQIRSQLSSDDSDLAVHIRPAWSPDGNWVIYERQPGSQASAAALVVVSADGAQSFGLTDGSHRDMSPAWAGPESIVFASDRGGAINLWQIQVDFDKQRATNNPVQITLGAGEDIDPAIATDGTLAYATLRRLQNLWSVGVDPDTLEFGDSPKRVMSASWNDLAPAAAPNNSATVFSSDRDGKYDIWLLPAGSDSPAQLTDRAGQDLQAVWSPDSSKLAFFSDEKDNNDIWVMNLAGGPPVVITPPESNDVNPYWSPDGTQFGFTSDRSGQSEVWKMNVDGSEAEQLTDIGMLGHTARWSPDANWLLFTSTAKGDRDIWAVRQDGSELLRLTTAPTQDAHGLWSPDGTSVLYLSDHQKMFVRPFETDEHQLLFDLGERIDFVHLSDDGGTFLFTRQKVEGDIWLIE